MELGLVYRCNAWRFVDFWYVSFLIKIEDQSRLKSWLEMCLVVMVYSRNLGLVLKTEKSESLTHFRPPFFLKKIYTVTTHAKVSLSWNVSKNRLLFTSFCVTRKTVNLSSYDVIKIINGTVLSAENNADLIMMGEIWF